MGAHFTREQILEKIKKKLESMPDFEFVKLYDSTIYIKTINKYRSEKRIQTLHKSCGTISDKKLCHFWKGDLCSNTECKNKKRKETNLNKYGVENVMDIPEIKIKQSIECKKSMNTKETLDKFYKSIQKRNYDSVKKQCEHKYNLLLLTSKEEYESKFKKNKYKCLNCNLEFSDKFNPYPACPICTPRKYKTENEIKNWISNLLNISIVDLTTRHKKNESNLRECYELDIDISDRKLGIEYHGLYWHSEFSGGKDRNYHKNKLEFFKNKGYNLIQIFENEWEDKRMIVQSIIKSKLGLNERIFARKCEIKKVDSTVSSVFLDANHIQGNVNASVKLGLYYNNELVALLTLGKSRYNKNYDWEILRYCSKLNTNVVGGFSKLLKYFIRNYNPKNIITYADRRYSNGNVYSKNGFELINISEPNYFYTTHQKDLYSRVQFQKHKLQEKLKIFNSELTEVENMKLNGYDRIWDCGNYVFTWSKK